MNDDTLAFFRIQPDALRLLATLLRIQEMLSADQIHTRREIRTYLESGDPGAARALIQHAKARRELCMSKRADSV